MQRLAKAMGGRPNDEWLVNRVAEAALANCHPEQILKWLDRSGLCRRTVVHVMRPAVWRAHDVACARAEVCGVPHRARLREPGPEAH